MDRKSEVRVHCERRVACELSVGGRVFTEGVRTEGSGKASPQKLQRVERSANCSPAPAVTGSSQPVTPRRRAPQLCCLLGCSFPSAGGGAPPRLTSLSPSVRGRGGARLAGWLSEERQRGRPWRTPWAVGPCPATLRSLASPLSPASFLPLSLLTHGLLCARLLLMMFHWFSV